MKLTDTAIKVSLRHPLLIWSIIQLSLLVAVSGYAFTRNIGYLFPGGDGSLILYGIAHQRAWMPFAFGFFAEPLQGLGDMSYPLNIKLEIGYLLPALFLGSDAAASTAYQTLSHIVFAVELFCATLLLARVLGFHWIVSLIAAFITPLLSLPYFGLPLLYPLFVFVPHYATLSAAGMLVIALVHHVSATPKHNESFRTVLIRGIVATMALFLIFAYLLLTFPIGVSLCVPLIGAGVLGALLSAANHRDRIAKLSVPVAALGGLALTGFATFALGIFRYTTPTVFGAELGNDRMQEMFVSTWYTGAAGKYLIIGSILGMAIAVFAGSRRLRAFAAAMLLLMAALYGFGWMSVKYDFWRGPSPVYVETMLWPIYTMFGVYALVTPILGLIRRFGRTAGPNSAPAKRMISTVATAAALVAAPIAAFATARHVDNPVRIWGQAFPPTNRPMIAYLREQIALRPGESFKGRVATLLLIEKDEPVSFPQLIGRNGPRVERTGNDFYWSGMWYYNIPTFFEYAVTTSPAYYRAAVELLGRPGDIQFRNVTVIRKPDVRALELFGVRFVISDSPLSKPFRLVMTEDTGAGEVLHLYELPRPNLGTLSPTKVIQAHSYAEALNVMAAPEFDPSRSAIVFEATEELAALQGASQTSVVMNQGGLRVRSQSDGQSIIVLPFEYSHCLILRSNLDNDKALPRLLRVNALETAVLFESKLDVSISYFTGPFTNSGCRLEDHREFSSLIRSH